MKWLDEKENLQELINQDIPYDEIGKKYNVSGASIRKAAKRLGIELPRRRKINPNETFNKGKISTAICMNCGKTFIKYPSSKGKFCSMECNVEYKFNKNITDWKEGVKSGTNGYSQSSFVKRYLLHKYNNKCQKCGWGEINPFTGRVPLQVHHIDGNSCNNSEDNLQLLCPNCHSLTENYGSRNKNAPRGKSVYYGKAKAD